ncbi:MAG: hypothetical protein M1833_003397 [Piccolia ochrophora]|nr:MAG: hypothetical protein M1833_003397 [Piccolia ochrophora]
MLHEILLSLSGHPSPLLSTPHKPSTQTRRQPFPFLTPPEEALLSSLTRLSHLHQSITTKASVVFASHPSTICRAISTSVVSTHLAIFQEKIVEVERDIIEQEADKLTVDGVVPLSAVVGQFEPWKRRIEWLWEVVQFMKPDERHGSTEHKASADRRWCTGAAILNKLREEIQTGYPDLEDTALDLLRVAETAWLRQLSTWVLYGKLPTTGAADFFVQPEKSSTGASTTEFKVQRELSPSFVTKTTASSILFIGRALNHVRARSVPVSISTSSISTSPELALLPSHLRLLAKLTSPLSATGISNAISAIRLSVSQNALQQLLPLPKILEVLSVLCDFFLLCRGNFAVVLINEADERIKARWRRPGQHQPPNQLLKDLRSVVIKEGEVAAVLTRTWGILHSYQNDEEIDDTLDLARDLVSLSLSRPSFGPPTPHHGLDPTGDAYTISDVPFNDLLLSTPTSLELRITSPLDLFLSRKDLNVYSTINAYLLSIRRAHFRLTGLWKETALRRDHPAPLGPPYSNTRSGSERAQAARIRANDRARTMRTVWAVSGAAVFLLAGIGEYFQGEVVHGSWEEFRSWLEHLPSPSDPSTHTQHERPHSGDSRPPTSSSNFPTPHSRPSTSSSAKPPTQPTRAPTSSLHMRKPPTTTTTSRPTSSSSTATPQATPHDPETLSLAHTTYLSALTTQLLLTDRPFTLSLRALLLATDTFTSLITRLSQTWQTLDLETDEGVVDAFSDVRAEEKDVLGEVERVRERVRGGVKEVIGRLRVLDQRGEGGWRGTSGSVNGGKGDLVDGGFVPWRGRGVGRLLMRLEFGSLVDDGPEAEEEGAPQ